MQLTATAEVLQKMLQIIMSIVCIHACTRKSATAIHRHAGLCAAAAR
jgi:hypothetical protein